jgi:hypothetical protein
MSFLARTALVLGIAGCACGSAPVHRGPARTTPAASTSSASPGAPARQPTFASQRSKPIYEQAVAGMRAIDALRGAPMTESLATDLGFKCADLKQLRKDLEPEPDAVIWRLRNDIERTCGFDVPLASALLEIAAIQKKRAADPTAPVDIECRALQRAIDDLGAAYIGNDSTSDVIAKDTTYCGHTDTVRRVP